MSRILDNACRAGIRCGGCENKSNFEQHGEPRWRFCPDCGRPQTEEAWEELRKRLEGKHEIS